MLDLYPPETKRKFTQMFIREMILNTSSANFYFLEELLSREGKNGEKEELEKREIKDVVKDYFNKNPQEKVRDYLREEARNVSFSIDFENYDERGRSIKTDNKNNSGFMVPVGKPILPPSKKVLRIPEYRLPRRFINLRPVREEKKNSLDLGKLNPLIFDMNVRVIECQGAGVSIMVGGKMGRKPTNIVLTEEEIGEIINKFSVEARIPIEEGIFKVALGNLVLTSTVSSTGSNFIIKKI